MAHLPQIDHRFRWLSETISIALGIFDTNFAEQLVAENGDLIDAFFNDDINEQIDSCKQILYVWRTFYDKLVEETITVLEEGNFFVCLNIERVIKNVSNSIVGFQLRHQL